MGWQNSELRPTSLKTILQIGPSDPDGQQVECYQRMYLCSEERKKAFWVHWEEQRLQSRKMISSAPSSESGLKCWVHFLGFLISNRQGHSGTNTVKGLKNAQGTETEETEKAGTVLHEEENA